MIDQEVREIINQQYETAYNIIEAKKSLLKKSAELLLEKETIKGQTLEKMIVEEQTAEA
jgi:cell division protease FtsH